MLNIDFPKLFAWLGILGFCGFFWWLVGMILTSPVMVSRLAEVWAGVMP
jgi:hypothetical protein